MRLTVAVSLPILAIALQYVTTIRALSDDPVLRNSWRYQYPPPGATVWQKLGWLPGAVDRLARNPLHASVPVLAGVLFVVGSTVCWRRSRLGASLLVIPLLVQIVAALANRYPLGDRLALALIPNALILAAGAVASIPVHLPVSAARIRLLPAALSASCLLVQLVPQAWSSKRLIAAPQTVAELRPVMQQVKAQAGAHEAFMPYFFTAAPYVYYARRLGLPLPAPAVGFLPVACAYSPQLASLRPGESFWFVYTALDASVAPGIPDPNAPGTMADIRQLIAALSHHATPGRHIAGLRAGAVEFTVDVRPSRQPPHEPGRCLAASPLPIHV